MNKKLSKVLIKLSNKGYSQARLAREISKETGQKYNDRIVTRTLHYWVGQKTEYNSVPRGKALKILTKTSEIIGEPVIPDIAYLMNHQAA